MAMYLGKGGRVFGPFSEQEMEDLKLSAEIENYTYLWDDASGQWFNIDPLPPAPGTSEAAAADKNAGEISDEAICHNSQELVSGWLTQITDMGCELVSSNPSDTPELGINTSCVLNVMDAARRKAMNVKARLVESTRRDGHWVYRLRWAKRPAF